MKFSSPVDQQWLYNYSKIIKKFQNSFIFKPTKNSIKFYSTKSKRTGNGYFDVEYAKDNQKLHIQIQIKFKLL